MINNSKKVSVPFQDLPPVNNNNQYQFRYKIISDDNSKQSDWSSIYTVDNVPVTTVYGSIQSISSAGSPTIATISWGDENARPSYDVFVKFTYSTSYSQVAAANTSTLYFATKPNIKVGDKISVSGAGTNYDVTNANVTSISYTTTPIGGSYYFIVSYQNTNAIAIVARASLTTGKLFSSFFYHGTSPIHTYQIVTETAIKTSTELVALSPSALATYLSNSDIYGKPSAMDTIIQISSQKKSLNANLQIFTTTSSVTIN